MLLCVNEQLSCFQRALSSFGGEAFARDTLCSQLQRSTLQVSFTMNTGEGDAKQGRRVKEDEPEVPRN